MKILFIEDSLLDYHLIDQMIHHSGLGAVEFKCQSNLAAGLDLLTKETIDVVLLDLNLPDSSGLDTLHSVIQHVPNIPVIVLSGSEDEQIGLQAVKQGAQDYLIKARVNTALLERSIRYAMDRKQIENLGRESEQSYHASEIRLRTLLNNIPLGIFRDTPGPRGDILMANPVFLKMFGIDSEEALHRISTSDLYPNHADRQHFSDMMLEAGEVHSLLIQLRRLGGTIVWGSISSRLVKDKSGRPLYFDNVIEDITPRIELETAYRTFVENSLQALFIMQNGRIAFANPAMTQITGYTLEEMLPFSASQIVRMVYPHDRTAVLNVLKVVAQPSSGDEHLTFRLVRKDKEIRWVDTIVIPVEYQGKPAVQAILVDITEKIQAEEALRESEAQYRLLADSIQDVVGLHESDGRTVYVSPSFEKLTGRSSKEFLEAGFFGLDQNEKLAAMKNSILAKLASGDNVVFEWQVKHNDGHLLWVETVAHPIMDNSLHLQRWISSSRDITERFQTREALQETNKQLKESVDSLEERNRNSQQFIAMGDMLQSCLSQDEVYGVVKSYSPNLFPGFSGSLYLLDESSRLVKSVVQWGGDYSVTLAFETDSCWALRRGRPHIYQNPGSNLLCQHVDPKIGNSYACVPLVALGETVGLYHLLNPDVILSETFSQFAIMIAERVALALVNLRLRDTLRDQSIRDPLTSLFNRRYLMETIAREFSRAVRHGVTLGIVMMDIDHFKLFNDNFGHDAGDVLLQALGNYLLENSRGEDVACRYGGEEFVLILPDTSFEDTLRRAEEFAKSLSSLSVQHRGVPLGKITVSMGVAAYPLHGETIDELLKSADIALYRAKNEGRNRVAGPPDYE